MLKIWLTWLQPSLGVLGTALVLSNPLYSSAATKPVTVDRSKTPTQPPQWSSTTATSAKIHANLLSGIAVTPDMAVRQLAINAMTTKGVKPTSFAAKSHPTSELSALSNFSAPAVTPKRSATKVALAKKPHAAKNSVAAQLARAIDPQSPIPVPGLYIGNSNVRESLPVTTTAKNLTHRSAAPIASATQIGTPTPLSAMMAVKRAPDPFPVVRPELMQKLDGNAAVASAPKIKIVPQDLNPIATIPSKLPRTTALKPVAPTIVATRSLDPIAEIPSGLQRLLGNNLNSQPTIAAAPVAKAITTNSGSLVALQQLVSPTNVIPSASVSGASLQLATAQAYTSVPKFDIPGETLLATKPVKPTGNVLVVKRVEKDVTLAVAERNGSYTSLMSDRQLTSAPKQPWTISNQRNNLGGLILGSQQLTSIPKVVTLLPGGSIKTDVSSGLPGRSLFGVN